jgi:Flp pilus assembly protein TadD
MPEALACYDRAVGIAPTLAGIHFNRALILHETHAYADALQGYLTAARLDPSFADAFNAAGLMLQRLARPEEALAHFQRAIVLQPKFAEAHSNAGCALRDLGDVEGALSHFNDAIKIQDDFVAAYSNRGAAYTELGRLAEALADYDRTLELVPDFAAAHCNRSYVHLVAGNFAVGWADYEWRMRMPGNASSRQDHGLNRPLWRGDFPLAERTILVYSEQGFGDTLQFCRYVGKLAAAGARVVLEVPATLVSLLESLPGVAQVVARGSHLPDYDCHIPIMSLPYAFRTTLETVPADIPYVHPDPQKVGFWSRLLGPKSNLRVGLVWSGGFRPEQPELWAINRRRNIALEKLAVLRHPAVDFYSLQKGQPAESELAELQRRQWDGPTLIDHTRRLQDFSDTAALISQLDIVISVDTAIAHLAGAMGKPVWMMNRYDTCWRWLLERTDSPWYPSLTLYRQRTPECWDGVIEQVRRDLCRLVHLFDPDGLAAP